VKILLAHNFYQQPGGEDEVFRTERDLLISLGHDVSEFVIHNQVIDSMPKLDVARATIWNKRLTHDLRAAIASSRANIVHFHNTFPLISPAAYSAAHADGAAVVQTLHNFRMICAAATLFRDNHVCEKCVGRLIPLSSILHNCYHHGRAATSVIAASQAFHNLRGTWTTDVDLYISPTASARQKFIDHGLPSEKILVKPNILYPDPGPGTGDGNFAIFVGRLSSEKGLDVVLQSWQNHNLSIPLKIVGDGPLAPQIQSAAARHPNIQWLGRRPQAEVLDLIGSASMLIFPSRCYETFGRVILEAFARATPVIASNHGAPADLIQHEQTGLLFPPGYSALLASQVLRLVNDTNLRESMRSNCRADFESKYTPQIAHDQLLHIYRRAIAARPLHEPRHILPEAVS